MFMGGVGGGCKGDKNRLIMNVKLGFIIILVYLF